MKKQVVKVCGLLDLKDAMYYVLLLDICNAHFLIKIPEKSCRKEIYLTLSILAFT